MTIRSLIDIIVKGDSPTHLDSTHHKHHQLNDRWAKGHGNLKTGNSALSAKT
jgi:hypothetical protein